MNRLAAAILFASFGLLPATALADRVLLRSGQVVEGTARFEGSEVVVQKSDGAEVRVPQTDVERIEMSPAPPAVQNEAPPPTQPPARPPVPPARPPPPPPYGRYYRPRYSVPPPPILLNPAWDRSGLALTAGYHRGFSLGAEWQQRLSHSLSLGVGGQVGTEPSFTSPDYFFTWGVTGRIYAGGPGRFVGEVGLGLNLIDDHVCNGTTGACLGVARSVGPEFSIGYQHVSATGFLVEALVGLAVATNPVVTQDRSVSPTFQISAGYLFH